MSDEQTRIDPDEAWLEQVRCFREDVPGATPEQASAARASLGLDDRRRRRGRRATTTVAAVAGLGMAAAAVGFVVMDRSGEAIGPAAGTSSSTTSVTSDDATEAVQVLADGRVQVTLPDGSDALSAEKIDTELRDKDIPIQLMPDGQLMQPGDWQMLWFTHVGYPEGWPDQGWEQAYVDGDPDFPGSSVDVEYADSSQDEAVSVTFPETPEHLVVFQFHDADATNAVPATSAMNPYPESSPLHCLSMHDEPLSEVAAKLADIDIDVTYSLPVIPKEGDVYWTHLTQAEAEADTEHKVSEVIQRNSGELEVYFTTKDDMDFMDDEMRESFEESCPDPR